MLRVYVLHSLTQENPGNEYIFDSVQDTRANMQTHLEIATNLVHEYGLVAYADELIELQTLVTTTTEQSPISTRQRSYSRLARVSIWLL